MENGQYFNLYLFNFIYYFCCLFVNALNLPSIFNYFLYFTTIFSNHFLKAHLFYFLNILFNLFDILTY